MPYSVNPAVASGRVRRLALRNLRRSNDDPQFGEDAGRRPAIPQGLTMRTITIRP